MLSNQVFLETSDEADKLASTATNQNAALKSFHFSQRIAEQIQVQLDHALVGTVNLAGDLALCIRGSRKTITPLAVVSMIVS